MSYIIYLATNIALHYPPNYSLPLYLLAIGRMSPYLGGISSLPLHYPPDFPISVCYLAIYPISKYYPFTRPVFLSYLSVCHSPIHYPDMGDGPLDR